MHAAAAGSTDQQIAIAMGITLSTVRTYWKRVMAKTESVNRAAAIATILTEQHDLDLRKLERRLTDYDGRTLESPLDFAKSFIGLKSDLIELRRKSSSDLIGDVLAELAVLGYTIRRPPFEEVFDEEGLPSKRSVSV